MVQVNFSDVEDRGSFDPIPAGPYLVAITDVTEVERTQDEIDDGKFNYLSWELTVQEGEYEGRKLWETNSFSPKALWRMRDFLKACGVDEETVNSAEGLEFDPPDFIGTQLRVAVKMTTYNGEPSNEISSIKNPNEGSGSKVRAGKAAKGPKVR